MWTMQRLAPMSAALLERVREEVGPYAGGADFAPAAPEPRRAEGAAPAQHPSPLLRVEGVSIDYRTPQRAVRATHQVSFDVHPADRLVLLGASG